MSTFNNFTTTVSFSDFSADNWDALVKDGISTEHISITNGHLLICELMI